MCGGVSWFQKTSCNGCAGFWLKRKKISARRVPMEASAVTTSTAAQIETPSAGSHEPIPFVLLGTTRRHARLILMRSVRSSMWLFTQHMSGVSGQITE